MSASVKSVTREAVAVVAWTFVTVIAITTSLLLVGQIVCLLVQYLTLCSFAYTWSLRPSFFFALVSSSDREPLDAFCWVRGAELCNMFYAIISAITEAPHRGRAWALVASKSKNKRGYVITAIIEDHDGENGRNTNVQFRSLFFCCFPLSTSSPSPNSNDPVLFRVQLILE